jgi:acyl-CoA thioester hydrolase
MIDIRVAFADTDAMGIVHHSNYLRYFEVARVGWLRLKGHDYRDWQKAGRHMPLVESHCRYKKPARFDDVLEINVKPRIEGVRVIFDYAVKNKATQELLSEGYTIHVAVNEQMKLIDLPIEFIKIIQEDKKWIET